MNYETIEDRLRAIGSHADALPFKTPTIEELRMRDHRRLRKRTAMLALPGFCALLVVGMLIMDSDTPRGASVIAPETSTLENLNDLPMGAEPATMSLTNHKTSQLRAFQAVHMTIPLLVIDNQNKQQEWTWMVYESKRPVDLDALTDAERHAAFRVMDHKSDRLYEL